MRARLRLRLSRPSPGMVVAVSALMVALGGTAVAATATIVNIADPTIPSNKAKVDATGALRTAGTVSGYVGEAVPRAPFFRQQYLVGHSDNTLIAATTATVALTRLSFENYYDQTNGAPVVVTLVQRGGSSTICDGSSGQKTIGVYDVPAGQTFSDAMESPIVLSPVVAGHVWCLLATTAIQGSPTSYFSPGVAWSGYVVSGTLPPGPSATPSNEPGQPPRLALSRP